jgi:hypothetical protein
MPAVSNKVNQLSEDQIAHWTNIAYQAILERGFRGSFIELELSLWDAIRIAAEPRPNLPSFHLPRVCQFETV